MHIVCILLEHIDVSNEGLIVKLWFIDDEDGDLSVVGCASGQKVHAVLCDDDLSEDIIFYLFAFEIHSLLN